MKENQITENWTAARYIRENGEILDFTGLYEVSDMGRVRSLNYNQTGKAKIMNPGTIKCSDESIYYKVELRKDHKCLSVSVHRLILSSFDPTGWKPEYVVNHKKERTSISCDNRLQNLEWMTQKSNVNTENSKALRSKVMRNKPDRSKPIRVTFSDGTQRTFPSAMEVTRVLNIPNVISICINRSNGYYKKRMLYFEYM